MMKRMVITAVSVVAVFLSGCGAIARNYAMEQARYVENAMEIARERASFDMGCDGVSGKLLGDVIPFEGYRAMVIGVTGCDKKASYLIRCKHKSGKNYLCTSSLDAFTE
jgi:uncharacterized protein YceK